MPVGQLGHGAPRQLDDHRRRRLVASSTGPSTSTVAAAAGAGAAGERILVLVQLNGGNDGLNTLVPADGRYRDARPSLAVPEEELVALPGESAYALHPSLAPLRAALAGQPAELRRVHRLPGP